MNRFKISAELAILACVIAWIIALPLGILSSLKRNSIIDRIVRVVALLGVSVPNFASATLLILFLSKTFHNRRRPLSDFLQRKTKGYSLENNL